MKLLLLVLLPLALLRPTAAEDPLCPSVCPAEQSSGGSGSLPAGVTYSMTFNPPVPGDGTETCATCHDCTMTGSLIFNSNGTGWCMRFTLGGVGTSNPLTSYSRPGKLSANCDTSECLFIEIVSCATGGGGVFTDLKCVNCGCDAV